jgi:hypothetical protein
MLSGFQGYTLEKIEDIVILLGSSVCIHHALDELKGNFIGDESKKPQWLTVTSWQGCVCIRMQ